METGSDLHILPITNAIYPLTGCHVKFINQKEDAHGSSHNELMSLVFFGVNQIATAAEEQTATTSEISKNIQQITEVVHDTARGAQESAAAANQLAKLAEDLQEGVEFFKTEETRHS